MTLLEDAKKHLETHELAVSALFKADFRAECLTEDDTTFLSFMCFSISRVSKLYSGTKLNASFYNDAAHQASKTIASLLLTDFSDTPKIVNLTISYFNSVGEVVAQDFHPKLIVIDYNDSMDWDDTNDVAKFTITLESVGE